MAYFKYPSLTNHYAINKSRQISEALETLCYSTEKIHGSNVQFAFERDEPITKFKAYSRGGTLISGTDSEGNVVQDKQFPLVADMAVAYNLPEVAADIFADYHSIDKINIYGEYFGSGVQKTNYTLSELGEKDFQVFDILYSFKGEDEDTRHSMGLAELLHYVGAEKMATIERFGSLKDLIATDIPTDSTYGGQREGNVYKSVNGMAISPNIKYLGIKHKRPEFSEVASKPKQPKQPVKHSDELLELASSVEDYVTINRMRNVHSHGDIPFTYNNIGKIMYLFKQDIIKEFTEDNSEVNIKELEKALKMSDRQIAMLAKDVINELGEVED